MIARKELSIKQTGEGSDSETPARTATYRREGHHVCLPMPDWTPPRPPPIITQAFEQQERR